MKRLTVSRNESLSLRALLLLLSLALGSAVAVAQVPVDGNGNPTGSYRVADSVDNAAGDAELLSPAELEELVGPIALYPDDLLAIVLPASAYPLEIVQAARFLEALENDPSLEPDEDWDDSVVALLNYPDVVRMMDDDIDWTWRLGEAVLAQQAELIAAVEAFRDRAYAAGNLRSDDKQNVSVDDGVIEIVPVDDEIIYVPYYEPAEVVVYQPRTVYYYYPEPYPVYYYPYPAGYHFHSGFFWGVTTAFTIGWPNHYLHVYHPSYWGHPYYGRYYYGHYYRRPSITVYNTWYVNGNHYAPTYRYRDGDYWRPRARAGARQYEPRVVNHHYPPGSRDRYPVSTRRDTLRQTDTGRMDLTLRPRGENRAAPAGTARVQTRADAGRTGRTGTTGRRNETARTEPAARRTETAAASAARRSTAIGRSGATGSTGTTRRGNGTATRSADRLTDGARAVGRVAPGTGRTATSTAGNSRRTAVAGTRQRSETGRQAAASAATRPSTRSATPSGRATQAPASRAAPAARSEARSSGRGDGAAPAGRRAASGSQSGSRRRNGHDR